MTTTRTTTRIAARTPFDASTTFGFLASRVVPGIETAGDGWYARTLRLPRGQGIAVVTSARRAASIDVELTLEDGGDHHAATEQIARLFDVDADPAVIDAHLGRDPLLAPLVAAAPGRRVPGSVDVFETAVRAIIGQQISTSGARTVAARLVTAVGERLRVGIDGPDGSAGASLRSVFPGPAAVAAAPDESLAMPGRRAGSIRVLGAAVADGSLRLDPSSDPVEVRARLQLLPGIGPWTADYVCMRGLGDADAYLPTDLGVRRALEWLGATDVDSDRWRPWRAYALHHLWAVPGPGSAASMRSRPTVRPRRSR